MQVKFVRVWTVALLLVLTACGSDTESGDQTGIGGDTSSTGETSNSSDGTTVDNSNAITVEVGIFERTGEDSYEQLSIDPFEFVVGESCQTWSRKVRQPSPNDSIQTEHDHFNAADEVSWNSETRTITWLEYGPEHSQDEIDATCAAAQDGAFKEVNDTDYYFDGNQGETNDAGEYIGFYLKVISVTGE